MVSRAFQGHDSSAGVFRASHGVPGSYESVPGCIRRFPECSRAIQWFTCVFQKYSRGIKDISCGRRGFRELSSGIPRDVRTVPEGLRNNPRGFLRFQGSFKGVLGDSMAFLSWTKRIRVRFMRFYKSS